MERRVALLVSLKTSGGNRMLVMGPLSGSLAYLPRHIKLPKIRKQKGSYTYRSPIASRRFDRRAGTARLRQRPKTWAGGCHCGARQTRSDYVEDNYSLAEALLWLGVYLALNLQLWSLQMLGHWWGGNGRAASDFARPFYWTTWVLIWVLPAVVLVRGVRQKDRFIMAVGGIVSVLTLVSNKPYLGWPRQTWDPMLLGILLAGVALLLRRWLARGAGGVRGGFTAARLSGKDRKWMNATSAVFGLVTPQSITPSPQTRTEDFRFGGGASGGGGAGGDF